jgi:hypothetical protein
MCGWSHVGLIPQMNVMTSQEEAERSEGLLQSHRSAPCNQIEIAELHTTAETASGRDNTAYKTR